MVVCRFVYSLLPLTLTLGSLVLSLVTLFGSYKHSTSVTEKVFFLQLDLSNIDVSGYDASTLVSEAGIYPIYQVGSGGYCYGTLDTDDNVDIVGCATPTTPFWFDFLGIFEDSLAGDLLSDASLPTVISEYNTVLKAACSAHWCLLIAVAGLSFIMILMGIFSACSKGLSCCILMISFLNSVAAIAAAAIATATFIAYEKLFTANASAFGASSKLGTTGLGLVWGAALAAVLSTFFWLFTTCFGSTSRSARSVDRGDYKEVDAGSY